MEILPRNNGKVVAFVPCIKEKDCENFSCIQEKMCSEPPTDSNKYDAVFSDTLLDPVKFSL